MVLHVGSVYIAFSARNFLLIPICHSLDTFPTSFVIVYEHSLPSFVSYSDHYLHLS